MVITTAIMTFITIIRWEYSICDLLLMDKNI